MRRLPPSANFAALRVAGAHGPGMGAVEMGAPPLGGAGLISGRRGERDRMGVRLCKHGRFGGRSPGCCAGSLLALPHWSGSGGAGCLGAAVAPG